MRFLGLCAVAALSIPIDRAAAQVGLQLAGNVRLRYEAIDNQPRAGFGESDDLIGVRTILTAEYRGDGWRIGGELYDSRVYSADSRTPVSTSEVNALEPVQAWIAADIASPLGAGSKATVQAGRFTLNLGSRRLVAADDYRNTTNGYTGLRADIATKGGIKGTLIYVLPQIRRPDNAAGMADNRVKLDRESFDQVLWGGLIARPNMLGTTMAELSFYHFGERDTPARPTRDRSLDTLGLRLIREPKAGRWDHEIEVIGQRGSLRTSNAAAAPLRRVSAWFVHVDAGYSFTGGWAPRLSVEFDYASGDKGAGKVNRFDTLFGMRRADLAPSGLYNAVGRANILTPAIRIEAAPSKHVDLMGSYRTMWLASRTDAFSTTGVRDTTGRSGRFAGQQIDARIRWWAVPDRLRLEADAVLLLKGRFLETAPNAPAGGNTRYVSLNVTTMF
jgi:hypothetical protein